MAKLQTEALPETCRWYSLPWPHGSLHPDNHGIAIGAMASDIIAINKRLEAVEAQLEQLMSKDDEVMW